MVGDVPRPLPPEDRASQAKEPVGPAPSPTGARDASNGQGRERMSGKGEVAAAGAVIDVERIMQMIPHRYPFLMIDRVVDVVPDQTAVGIKNVSINDYFFQGHFPGHAVMPGVLLIEAMAQTAAVLVVHTLGPEAEGKLVYFMSIEHAKFRRPVVPGDQLHVHVTKERNRGPVWKLRGEVKVNGTVVADAAFSAMIRDRE
jgi:3-hydroxyacyl-[acyl-carrier-protein] dehydratase